MHPIIGEQQHNLFQEAGSWVQASYAMQGRVAALLFAQFSCMSIPYQAVHSS